MDRTNRVLRSIDHPPKYQSADAELLEYPETPSQCSRHLGSKQQELTALWDAQAISLHVSQPPFGRKAEYNPSPSADEPPLCVNAHDGRTGANTIPAGLARPTTPRISSTVNFPLCACNLLLSRSRRQIPPASRLKRPRYCSAKQALQPITLHCSSS